MLQTPLVSSLAAIVNSSFNGGLFKFLRGLRNTGLELMLPRGSSGWKETKELAMTKMNRRGFALKEHPQITFFFFSL